MKRNVLLVVASSMVLMGLVVGIATGKSQGKRHEAFDYAGVTRVVLDDTQGTIDVQAGGKGAVHVDRTSTTLFARATSTAHVEDGVLRLVSRCNHTLCSVDYRVTVPAGVRVKVVGQNVGVTVAGTVGNVGVDASGEAEIDLSLARAVDVVAAHTRRGNITITVPRGSYAVSAQAAEGNSTATGITVNKQAKHSIRASTSSGNVTITGR
jgi:DUF4097 and DUF4098 domain-containing protein YvlB